MFIFLYVSVFFYLITGFYFNCVSSYEAVCQFLDRNGLLTLIRGHEAQDAGSVQNFDQGLKSIFNISLSIATQCIARLQKETSLQSSPFFPHLTTSTYITTEERFLSMPTKTSLSGSIIRRLTHTGCPTSWMRSPGACPL